MTRAPSRHCWLAPAVHHHLVREGLRTSAGLVVDTGSAREVHHFALLAGYGAEAVCPWLAFETVAAMADCLPAGLTGKDANKRFIKAINKGLFKVMSKMGISTYQSYCGCADFRSDRPERRFRRAIFHRHGHPDRRHRPARSRRRSRAHPSVRIRQRPGAGQRAGSGRRIRLPRARRRAHVDAGYPSPNCNTPRAPTMFRPTRNTPS